MDKFFLKIVLWFVNRMPLHDVNMQQVNMIASTKLILDNRRNATVFVRKQKEEPKNAMLFALLMYAIFSFFMGIVVFGIGSFVLAMIILHSYFIFMLIMTMITDFSNVLLDTSDSQIILPKPVSSRTLLVARTAHIIVYLGQIVLALMLIPLIATFIKYGILSGLLLILTIILTSAIGIFTTYILYGVVLRYANEQKVKDIIGYFQIFMTIFFAVGYQLIPRLISLEAVSTNFSLQWYSYLLPPVWMALFIDAFRTMNFDYPHIIMIISAIGVPMLSGWVIIKFLAPYYSSSLKNLNNTDTVIKKNTVQENKASLSQKLSQIFCTSNSEKAAFTKVWILTSREKSFKMQFYPSLAYIPVLIFIMVFKNFSNVDEVWKSLPQSNNYLWLLYVGSFGAINSQMLISYNENYLAGWIYYSSPIAKPGEILSGALKSLYSKFFLPVFIILSGVSFFIWGYKIIDDVVLAFLNSLIIFYTAALFTTHHLPFTQQPNTKEQSGRFVYVLLQIIIMSIVVGLHYVAIKFNWLVLVLIPVAIVIAFFEMQSIKKLGWNKFAV